MSNFTTYSSKTLGGLVVEKSGVCGGCVQRGILRTNGTAAVYFKSTDGTKFLVCSTGKKAEKWVREMLAAAKAAFA